MGGVILENRILKQPRIWENSLGPEDGEPRVAQNFHLLSSPADLQNNRKKIRPGGSNPGPSSDGQGELPFELTVHSVLYLHPLNYIIKRVNILNRLQRPNVHGFYSQREPFCVNFLQHALSLLPHANQHSVTTIFSQPWDHIIKIKSWHQYITSCCIKQTHATKIKRSKSCILSYTLWYYTPTENYLRTPTMNTF